jgi:hypothetical protein
MHPKIYKHYFLIKNVSIVSNNLKNETNKQNNKLQFIMPIYRISQSDIETEEESDIETEEDEYNIETEEESDKENLIVINLKNKNKTKSTAKSLAFQNIEMVINFLEKNKEINPKSKQIITITKWMKQGAGYTKYCWQRCVKWLFAKKYLYRKTKRGVGLCNLKYKNFDEVLEEIKKNR